MECIATDALNLLYAHGSFFILNIFRKDNDKLNLNLAIKPRTMLQLMV